MSRSIRPILGIGASILVLWSFGSPLARASTLSEAYTELPAGTVTDLSATGTEDWIKFGNGENNTTSFLNTTKIGNPVFLPGTLSPLGTAPSGSVTLIAFTGQQTLNFTWGDGNFGMYNDPGPVDTVVTETITPAVSSYPLGLGASFQAQVSAGTHVMDVYVQGFDADMLITASLTDGSTTSTVVSPTQNPASDPGNNYSLGDFQITYSGAGQTLTVSVVTQSPQTGGTQSAFPNAGFFAATVVQVPEPSTLMLGALALVSLGLIARRGQR